MTEPTDAYAGAAALTLVESLLVHLEEADLLDDVARDTIFDAAIGAHESAGRSGSKDTHAAIVTLLKRLQARSDGVQIVGDPIGPPHGTGN